MVTFTEIIVLFCICFENAIEHFSLDHFWKILFHVIRKSSSLPSISIPSQRKTRFRLTSLREEKKHLPEAKDAEDIHPVAAAFAQRALVIRKSRNQHAQEVFERSRQMLDKHNISTIDCRY